MRSIIVFGAGLVLATSALANDTTASSGAGGLVLQRTDADRHGLRGSVRFGRPDPDPLRLSQPHAARRGYDRRLSDAGPRPWRGIWRRRRLPVGLSDPRGGPADYRQARAKGGDQGQGLHRAARPAEGPECTRFDQRRDQGDGPASSGAEGSSGQARARRRRGIWQHRPRDEAPSHTAVDGQGQHVVAAALPGRARPGHRA